MERLVEADAKGRLNLGVGYAHQRFIVEEEDGTVTLKKAVIIPESELWLFRNKKALQAVDKGLEQAREGKLRKNRVDLDKYPDV